MLSSRLPLSGSSNDSTISANCFYSVVSFANYKSLLSKVLILATIFYLLTNSVGDLDWFLGDVKLNYLGPSITLWVLLVILTFLPASLVDLWETGKSILL